MKPANPNRRRQLWRAEQSVWVRHRAARPTFPSWWKAARIWPGRFGLRWRTGGSPTGCSISATRRRRTARGASTASARPERKRIGGPRSRLFAAKSVHPGRPNRVSRRRREFFDFGGVAGGPGFIAQLDGQRLHVLGQRQGAGPGRGFCQESLVQFQCVAFVPGGRR